MPAPQRGVGFDLEETYSSQGRVDLLMSGPTDGVRVFLEEAGVHRWQRVPPNAKHGEVHTSTVTVACLAVAESTGAGIRESDCAVDTMRGSGAGGQHRNKTESAVRIRHLATGLEVRVCAERSQHRNKALAMAILAAKIEEQARSRAARSETAARRAMIGTGERAFARRTYRVRDDVVIDHKSGRKISLKAFERGQLP